MSNDDFLLLLQAELDKAASERLINSDIDTIQKDIKHLQVKAEIDDASISKIVEKIKKISDQDIVIKGVKVDSGNLKKTKDQIQKSLNIDSEIENQVSKIMNDFGIVGSKGSKAFKEIKEAITEYRKELLSAQNITDKIDDNFDFFGNSADIDKVTSAITKNIKVANEGKKVYEELAEYISSYSKGKIHLPDSIKQEYGDDYSSMRSVLGKAFSTKRGTDFETFITELNSQLGNVVDLSHGAEAAFGDLVEKVRIGRSENYLSGDELFSKGLLDRNEVESYIDSIIDNINKKEIELRNVSESVTNDIIKDENKQKQAIRDIADAYDELSNSKNKDILDSFSKTLANVGMEEQKIKNVASDIDKLGITISSLTQKQSDKDIISVSVEGIDDLEQAVKITRQYKLETGELVSGIDSVSYSQAKASQNADNFAKQQSKAVTKATNDLNKLYSSAIDPSAPRPIQDSSHLSNLKNQYDLITNAIDKMNSASISSFTDEQNQVSKLTTDLEIMVKQYRNAENIATSLRTKNIDVIKNEFSSDLDVLVKKMQKSGVYTDGFKKGISNLKNILDNSSEKDQLVSFLNSLDKLKAGYNRAVASASLSNREHELYNQGQKVGIKASELTSLIENLQRTLPEINNFKTEINGAEVSVKSLLDELSKVDNASDFSVINEKFNAFKKLADAAGISVKNATKETKNIATQIDNINKLINGGVRNDYTTQISKLQGNFRSTGMSEDEVIAHTQKIVSAYNELKNASKNAISKEDYREVIELNDKLQSELINTRNEYDQLKASTKGYVTIKQRLAKANEIEAWNQKNTHATREVIAANEAYITSLRDLNTQMSKMVFDNINDGFKKNEISMRKMHRLGASLKEQFRQAGESFTQWLSVSSAVMFLVSKTTQAFTSLVKINSILTEISKTSDRTAESLKQLGNDSYEQASKYGRTAEDYLTSIQEMNRSGFYNEQGDAMAEQSLLAQSAGDMTEEIADKWILALNAAYKYEGEAQKINEVLDGTNNITNRNSVNMTDMAEAMSTVGSNAAQAGIKVDELASIIGTSVATTKKSGNEVGTAWKTLFINLQNVSSSKIVETLDKANASMTEMKNGVEQLRNPIDILRDLAKTYNSLDAKDPLKSEITTNIGGKHRANILSAFLSNFDQYEKMLGDYSEGSGSAMREAEKSANNLEGSLNSLGNTWNNIISNIADSDALIGIIKTFDGFLSTINKITDSLDSIGTIGAGIGLFTGLKNIGKHIRVYSFKINSCFEYALHA